MSEQREPTSVTRIGKFTVRVYDEQAYAENIRRYYGNDVPTTTTGGYQSRQYERQKSMARYNWTQWRGGPMIKEGA